MGQAHTSSSQEIAKKASSETSKKASTKLWRKANARQKNAAGSWRRSWDSLSMTNRQHWQHPHRHLSDDANLTNVPKKKPRPDDRGFCILEVEIELCPLHAGHLIAIVEMRMNWENADAVTILAIGIKTQLARIGVGSIRLDPFHQQSL